MNKYKGVIMESETVRVKTNLSDGSSINIELECPMDVSYPGDRDAKFKPIGFGIPKDGDYYYSRRCSDDKKSILFYRSLNAVMPVFDPSWIYEDVK